MKKQPSPCSRIARLAAAMLCLVAAPAVRADDGEWRSVAASAAQVARGVTGYEAGVAATDQGMVWVCQVVGRPDAAGSIRLTHPAGGVGLEVQHAASGDRVTVLVADDGAMFVMHDGVQVAARLPPPAVGLPGTTVGGEALRHLPAWRVYAGAYSDPNLRAATTTASGGSSACKSACDASVAVPARCADQQLDPYCCRKLADLRRCYAYCDCDANSPTPVACKLAADTQWVEDLAACDGLSGDPFGP